MWVVTIWIGGFLFNIVEQFNKCFIFCFKLSIAMTKFELFWCMCVLANQKVGKARKPLYGEEVAWNWPKSRWFNLVFLQLFFFCEIRPMSFCPLPYSLYVIMLTLSFDGVCTLVNLSLLTHSSWFSFMGCSFSWGCYDSRGLGKWWFLLRLVPNGHVSPYSVKGF